MNCATITGSASNIDLEAKDHQTIVSIIPALVERDAVAENVTNLLALLRCTVESIQRSPNQWENERTLSDAHYLTRR